jgi:hypothetical protein
LDYFITEEGRERIISCHKGKIPYLLITLAQNKYYDYTKRLINLLNLDISNYSKSKQMALEDLISSLKDIDSRINYFERAMIEKKALKSSIYNHTPVIYILLCISILFATTIATKYALTREVHYDKCPKNCPVERGTCFLGVCKCHSGWSGEYCKSVSEDINCINSKSCSHLKSKRYCSEISSKCTLEEEKTNWLMLYEGVRGDWLSEYKFTPGYVPCGIDVYANEFNSFEKNSMGVTAIKVTLCNTSNWSDRIKVNPLGSAEFDYRPRETNLYNICETGSYIKGIKLQVQSPDDYLDYLGICGVAIMCSDEDDWRLLYQYEARCK